MPPTLSIVVPAYNESVRLPPTMRKLAEFASGLTNEIEVLIVVERSTDGTLEIARETARQQGDSSRCFEIIANEQQRGKGHAVRTGMLRARGEHVFYMDADLSVPLAETRAFLDYFRAHPEADVLAGNRQHAQSRITRAQSWLRRSMGQTFNAILSRLAVADLRDTQCGFKAFRRAACQAIFSRQQLDGFAFDVEVLLLAQRLGFHTVDLPVEWINSPESKVHIARDSMRMLWDALRVRRLVDRSLNGPKPSSAKPEA